MKKVVVLFLILFVGFTSQAISLDTLANKTLAVVDSAKQSVINTANQVDTGRLSKQVYADFKQALAGIASALKVGVEHVYIVLVRQQVVKSITWFLILIAPTILFAIFKTRFYTWSDEHENSSDGFSWIPYAILWIAWIGLSIPGINHIETIVTGFVNPEYGAMTDIMDFIQKIRH